MPRNKGLGRGLDAIYIDNALPEDETKDAPKTVPISEIDLCADQPRKVFDPESLAALADSIRENGLLQPVLVRRTDLGRYEIVAGERRFRAAKLAGLTALPVSVLDADDRTAAKVALIENLQREDLSPLEEAAAYRRLMDRWGLTQEAVSAEVGKSRSAVANALRLLDLPEEAAALVADGSLTAGHARALLGLKNPADLVPAAKETVEKGLSVREVEALVKALNRKKKEPAERAAAPKVDYLRAIENRFTDRTGRRCTIRSTAKQKTITLEFRDDGDLEDLCRLLCGEDFFEEF
ncbi:MAG: ParB/RepB/Spo0J family partition protein [Clostridia bacterium]|nr:ParB/RepB/Spo0J family partition protein [Clostridia bacterium]